MDVALTPVEKSKIGLKTSPYGGNKQFDWPFNTES